MEGLRERVHNQFYNVTFSLVAIWRQFGVKTERGVRNMV